MYRMHDLKFYAEFFFRAIPVSMLWATLPSADNYRNGNSSQLRVMHNPVYCCYPGPRFSQPLALQHEKECEVTTNYDLHTIQLLTEETYTS